MPFLRIEKKKSGTYLRILESYRDEAGVSKHRILFSLGKAEDYTPEQLKRIGIQLYQLGGGEVKGMLHGEIREIGRYNYGYQYVYIQAIKQYGLQEVFRRISIKHKLSFDLYNTFLLMLIERVQDPCSKRANYFHQQEYVNLPQISLHHLYRTLDRLSQNNELIQQQIYQKGRDLFNSKLDVVFYDVTTFYFESEEEKQDEYRQKGFGKDGKIGNTQILFSMIIDANKNPIGYRIFKGNTFEGDTFAVALEDLKQRYQIDKVIVVADRGMLSSKNVKLTQDKGYEFILGERLKSLPAVTKQSLIDITQYKHEWIYKDSTGEMCKIKYTTIEHGDKTIICTYSEKRAKKDKQDRDEKIEKAEKILKNPSLLKNKQRRFYIKQTGNNHYQLDQNKILQQEKYDGFLAISTNTTLPVTEVLDNYKHLYKIEHSFRTFKSHLETRPMFHWTDTRIEGHICLCYIAFTLQNYILQKLNSKTKQITEKTLRETLDKMQLSLLEVDKQDELYIKSAPTEIENTMLHQLGLKPLSPMFKKEYMYL